MKPFATIVWMLYLLHFGLWGNDNETNHGEREFDTKNTEIKEKESPKQLFEYYGIRDGNSAEKIYSTYFWVKGSKKLGATTENAANIEMIQGNKCIAEKQVTKMGNDPAAAMTVGFVLCPEDDKLVRMSRRSKEIELVVPVEKKIELKVYGKSASEDTYFLSFEKLKDYKVNGTKYQQVIYREKKLFSDKQGKVLFAITKSYFVKDVGLVYEASYLAKNLDTPSMEKVLNQ